MVRNCPICGLPDVPGHSNVHRATWDLVNQLKALRKFRFLNTEQQEQDLEDIEAELQRRRRGTR